MTAFEPDALLDAARAATGLDDFGPDTFRPGLDALCASLDRRSAAQRPRRRGAMPGMVVGSLSNRLRVFDWIATHPEVRDERIEAPIVVIGMFRAGTTLLSRLFDQDAAQPRAADVGGGRQRAAADAGRPPRRAARRRGARQPTRCSPRLNPQIEVVHHEQADEATECITVMAQDFKSLTYEAVANIPSYDEWLLERRPALGVRVPPLGVAGAAERRTCAAGGRSRARTTRSRSSISPRCTPTPDSCCCTATRWCSPGRCAV